MALKIEHAGSSWTSFRRLAQRVQHCNRIFLDVRSGGVADACRADAKEFPEDSQQPSVEIDLSSSKEVIQSEEEGPRQCRGRDRTGWRIRSRIFGFVDDPEDAATFTICIFAAVISLLRRS